MTVKQGPSLETIRRIASEIPTPFHLYDEAKIRANARRLNAALTVMVYAYTAGQYKKEADRRLQSILGEQGEAL